VIGEESGMTLQRLDDLGNVVQHQRLDQARKKLESAADLSCDDRDTERAKEAMEGVLDARREGVSEADYGRNSVRV
jgi:hypothetical protein